MQDQAGVGVQGTVRQPFGYQCEGDYRTAVKLVGLKHRIVFHINFTPECHGEFRWNDPMVLRQWILQPVDTRPIHWASDKHLHRFHIRIGHLPHHGGCALIHRNQINMVLFKIPFETRCDHATIPWPPID